MKTGNVTGKDITEKLDKARKKVQELYRKNCSYKGDNTCPTCTGEEDWCHEHQQIQHALSKEGYDALIIKMLL